MAPSNGDPAVFIVTPGHYQLLVPGTKFKKNLALTGGSDEKMEMSVVVNK